MIEISNIKASLQTPELIQDRFFKNAEFQKDKRGRLISYTGGYTIVVPCTVYNEKWAFRCWHIPIKDAQKRYSLISKFVAGSSLPYLCSFEYVKKGVVVNGESLPITKMKWVEGHNLKDFICSNYGKKDIMDKLAGSFLEMVSELHAAGIAHGDLQHGNIMVSDSGEMFLVDYDSMYVPAMGIAFPDIITGLIDYQHPARKKNKIANEKLDYFSELVIYTSLLAIALNPQLIEDYNVKDTEALLFVSNDFANFKNSRIYADLKNLRDDNINRCLKVMSEYLLVDDINLLLPIESYLMSLDVSYPSLVAAEEPFTISWSTKGVSELVLDDEGKVELTGEMTFKIGQSRKMTFEMKSVSGYLERRIVSINVKKRGKIDIFVADKEFTLPSVPVLLSWSCSNVSNVELEGIGPQPLSGNIIVYPDCETKYVIKVVDAFGETRKEVLIRMLPLPVVQGVMVDIPRLNDVIEIRYNAPSFNHSIKIPEVSLYFAKVSLPEVSVSHPIRGISRPKSPSRGLMRRMSNFFKSIFG